MRKLLTCSLLTCLFAVCTPDDQKVPDNILSVDSMKVIIWDLSQAGAYASFLNEKDTATKILNTAYFAAALQVHHLTKKEFFKSFDFYQKQPLLNKQLFDSVSAYAQRKRNESYQKKFE
jgi:hypothetical protein